MSFGLLKHFKSNHDKNHIAECRVSKLIENSQHRFVVSQNKHDMEIIFLLIGISICLALFFLFSFLWATKNGQFEDTYGPSVRILFEDEIMSTKKMSNKNTEKCN